MFGLLLVGVVIIVQIIAYKMTRKKLDTTPNMVEVKDASLSNRMITGFAVLREKVANSDYGKKVLEENSQQQINKQSGGADTFPNLNAINPPDIYGRDSGNSNDRAVPSKAVINPDTKKKRGRPKKVVAEKKVDEFATDMSKIGDVEF